MGAEGVCACACCHVYTCVCLVCIDLWIRVCIDICMHARTHVCMYVYMHVRACLYVLRHVFHVFVRMFVGVRMYTEICGRMHVPCVDARMFVGV